MKIFDDIEGVSKSIGKDLDELRTRFGRFREACAALVDADPALALCKGLQVKEVDPSNEFDVSWRGLAIRFRYSPIYSANGPIAGRVKILRIRPPEDPSEIHAFTFDVRGRTSLLFGTGGTVDLEPNASYLLVAALNHSIEQLP